MSALDFWAFILPAVSFIEITIVGRLIVSEVLMLAMLPWLWSALDRLPLPRWFVVLWAGWLLAQIVTDCGFHGFWPPCFTGNGHPLVRSSAGPA